jgi:hypothetical protein
MEDIMKHVSLCLVFGVILLVVPLSTMGGKIASFYGMGNDSCGELIYAFSRNSFTQMIESDGNQWPSKSRAYVEWTLGYISAFNAINSQGKNLDHADLYGISAWLQKWCTDHPMDSVRNPTWTLIKERAGYKPGKDQLK